MALRKVLSDLMSVSPQAAIVAGEIAADGDPVSHQYTAHAVGALWAIQSAVKAEAGIVDGWISAAEKKLTARSTREDAN